MRQQSFSDLLAREVVYVKGTNSGDCLHQVPLGWHLFKLEGKGCHLIRIHFAQVLVNMVQQKQTSCLLVCLVGIAGPWVCHAYDCQTHATVVDNERQYIDTYRH